MTEIIPEWSDYQERTAAFFRSLGLEAETNAEVKGSRTHHDVDVLVKANVAGIQATWLIECKHVARPVSKVHVLALRQIVIDVGADKGILLCERGFQSGAIEAASLTNIKLSSLADLQQSTQKDFTALRLRDLYERTVIAKDRYWEIPKSVRTVMGLREEIVGWYSGFLVLQFAEAILAKTVIGVYPINDVLMPGPDGPSLPEFQTPAEVITTLGEFLSELERRLNICMAEKDRWTEIIQGV